MANTNLLGKVHASYVATRRRARVSSDRRLRREARRLQRRRERLDQPGLARLRAILDELQDRQDRRLPA